MTPAAHGYWPRDRPHGRPRQLRVAAKPPTMDRTDRETGRSSSATHHRSRRSVPDKLSGRGERIRVASAAFPYLVEKTKAQGRAETLSTVYGSLADHIDWYFMDPTSFSALN